MTGPALRDWDGEDFEFALPVVVIGAGGAGLCAALAARDAGVEVLVLERDSTPLGSTAMSTGLIPGPGTADQRAAGIDDSPELFVSDVMAKTKGRTDRAFVKAVADDAGETIEWMRSHGVPLSLVDGFVYPGHSVRRMYGTPNRSGGELIGALQAATEAAGAVVLTDATAEVLIVDGDRAVRGVEFRRPDGAVERVGCGALVLACCGFGGNAEMVRRFMPQMAEAVYHGHPGNRGDALRWGEALDARTADLSAFQGHGGLAAGHGVPILWPLIMEGGFQINAEGARFSNEATGYSEQAARVLAQPGGVAWSIFDERLHALMWGFEDYRDAFAAGAVVQAPDLATLAPVLGISHGALEDTVSEVEALTRGGGADRFGRDFSGKPPLTAPYYAAKVTGALFHTQGGLVVDAEARVVDRAGKVLPNLFASGGAARGISGDCDYGYLAGNGLLTATTLGKVAGRAAAALTTRSESA